jgi:hypothetical protein
LSSLLSRGSTSYFIALKTEKTAKKNRLFPKKCHKMTQFPLKMTKKLQKNDKNKEKIAQIEKIIYI